MFISTTNVLVISIKKFELVPKPWTVETGEMTPTLKLKRRVIKKKYEYLINKIYEIEEE